MKGFRSRNITKSAFFNASVRLAIDHHSLLLLLGVFAACSTQKFVSTEYDRRLPNGDLLPKLLVSGTFEYPDIARETGVEGTVWSKILISKTGAVGNVTIEKREFNYSGILQRNGKIVYVRQLFDPLIIEFWRTSRFEPAVKDGIPTDVSVTVPLHLKLRK